MINPGDVENAHDYPWAWAPLGVNMWRVSHDIAPTWTTPGDRGVVDIIDRNAPFAEYASPGHWNDAEMLVVGVEGSDDPPTKHYGGLSDTEDRAHFSMWAIMAAPLMAGNDLRKMSAHTLHTLTNREVVAVDQDQLGVQGSRIRNDGDHEVWVKEVGLKRSAGYVMADLWEHSTTFTAGEISAKVPAHGAAMFRVRPGTPDEAPAGASLSVGSPHSIRPWARDRGDPDTGQQRTDSPGGRAT